MAPQQMSGHEFRQRISWALGLAAGVGVGMAIGVATNNTVLGLVAGIAVGVAITVAIVIVDNRALRREHAARVAEAELAAALSTDATPHTTADDEAPEADSSEDEPHSGR